jgi:hypothetical protein
LLVPVVLIDDEDVLRKKGMDDWDNFLVGGGAGVGSALAACWRALAVPILEAELDFLPSPI